MDNTRDSIKCMLDIYVDDLPKGTEVLAFNPCEDICAKEMQRRIAMISTEEELTMMLAYVSNRFWYMEDDLYDYEIGSDEYETLRREVSEWGEMMHSLDLRALSILREENEGGLLNHNLDMSRGSQAVINILMERNGYSDAGGWWVQK